MDHAVPFDAVRPWRTAALLASGFAALELLVLVVAGVLLLAHPFAQHAANAAARRPAVVHAVPKHLLLARARTGVVVLNGNGRQGAAAAEALQVRGHGYRVRAVGNAPNPTAGPSIVMYRPGFRPEAARFARDLAIGVVAALDGLPPARLHGAQLAVVLGN